MREEIARQIGPRQDETKVVPYVQRYEFEGLLFSNVEVFAEQVDFPVTCRGELQAVRAQFTTPEDINDDPQTAPSKRIANVIPRYRKPLHGPLAGWENRPGQDPRGVSAIPRLGDASGIPGGLSQADCPFPRFAVLLLTD